MLPACEGRLDKPLGPDEAARNGDDSAVSSGPGGGDFASGDFDPSVCEGRALSPGAMPKLVRLSHLQYDNAVADLLGLDARAEAEFVADQQFFGFDNNAEKLVVAENQVLRYRAAAERLAAEAVNAPARIAEVVPCVSGARDTACRDRFVTDFLALMLRRPLLEADVQRYRALFDAGADLYDEGDAFARGMRIVLEAVLQSPRFIYRDETRAQGAEGDSAVALDDFELASRLAAMLWASVPDAGLFARAKAGELSDESVLEAEARRMLADARASRVLDDFHGQWLELDRLRYEKSPGVFQGYDQARFSDAANRELVSVARDVATSGGGISDLFRTPVAFAERTLAAIYGVTTDSAEPSRITLDRATRPGLLTRAGFLAGHADPIDSSPIHRGAFIQKRLLCTVYGPLPANVGNLPAREGDIVTTRDQVEAKTAAPACQFCHATINPPGFALERYDALGRLRDEDHGVPIDASATLSLDGREVSFDGAAELSEVLAESPTAMRCYETQWFRYALGRAEVDDDLCLLHEIDTRVAASGYAIEELLVALVMSRGFRFRATEEP